MDERAQDLFDLGIREAVMHDRRMLGPDDEPEPEPDDYDLFMDGRDGPVLVASVRKVNL